MKRIRTILKVCAATAALLVAMTGTASAHSCANASKPNGAGSIGDGYFTVYVDAQGNFLGDEERFEITRPHPTMPEEKTAGGFLSLHFLVSIDGGTPFEFAAYDTFMHKDLPDVSRFSAAGDACDGVGIDDLGTCLDEAIAELMSEL